MADNFEAAALAAESGLSEADALAFLQAQERRAAGVPSHTVQMEPFTDNTAVRTARVDRGGQAGWWFIDHSDGSCTWDTTPDKQWPAVFTPPETPTTPIA